MSIKKICNWCYFTRKANKKIYVYCKVNPRHKQRQLFSTCEKSIANSETNLEIKSKSFEMEFDPIEIMKEKCFELTKDEHNFYK